MQIEKNDPLEPANPSIIHSKK